VARLAATGATNAEIAAQLYLIACDVSRSPAPTAPSEWTPSGLRRSFSGDTTPVRKLISMGGHVTIQFSKSDIEEKAYKHQDRQSTAAVIVRQFAHDLRQPVAAVLALASAATADSQMPDAVRQRLRQIAVEADWISKILDDFLNGAGAAYNPEPVEIASLVRDVVASEVLTYRGQILMHQPDADESRYVLAVGTRLRRALANILANATRAAGPAGQIEVTQRLDGGAELIEIVDNGPGFGQLERVHGIGLEIAVRMLAECGGRMQVERQSYGQTLVRVSLPVVSGGPQAGGQ
jgi:signal transduction histidine kinase